MGVAVYKTKPERVLDDVQRLMETAGFREALPKDRVTILKDNISWHLPYLSANSVEGGVRGKFLAVLGIWTISVFLAMTSQRDFLLD